MLHPICRPNKRILATKHHSNGTLESGVVCPTWCRVSSGESISWKVEVVEAKVDPMGEVAMDWVATRLLDSITYNREKK